MRRETAVRLAGAAAVAVFACVLSLNAAPGEPAPEYVFSYAENQTEGYPTTLGAERFAQLVEERTDGRIRILVKSGGELGTEQEVIWQVQHGGIDFARVSLSQLAEYVPRMNILQMPYLYTGSEHMWRVLDGGIGEEFLDEVSGFDLVGLSWYDAGARNFYLADRPITCLEDIAGLRIRVQNSDLMVDMVQALGATAVPTEYDEVYGSIERGIVDGAENNLPSYESMRHYEVAPYFTEDEHTRVPEMQLCSGPTWEKLSEEDRGIILACAKESALYERELWTEREEESRQVVLSQGVTIVELSEEEHRRFRDAVLEVYEKYCGDDMDIIVQIIREGTT